MITRKLVQQLITESGFNPKDYNYVKHGRLWAFCHNGEYYMHENNISGLTAKAINTTQNAYKAVFISCGCLYIISER